MKYQRSCINYQGNKYRILNHIIHLFPKNINTFVDVFAGSGVMSLNTKANNYISNDICWSNNFLKQLKENGYDYVLNKILQVVEEHCLNKTDKQSFKDFIKYININGLEKDYIYIYIYI